MKRIVSLVLALSMILSMFSFSFASSTLKDVVGTNYEPAVEALMELKIVDGYPDGTYLPENVVTRAELAKLLVTAYGLNQAAEVASGTTPFSDVAGNWAAGYISVSADYKFVNGYPEGTFKPNETVTYAEAITMCLRVLGYTKEIDSKGTWPTNYIAKAQELKLTKDFTIKSYNDGATRGNIALLIWKMLRTKMWTVIGESEGDGLMSEANREMINVKFPDYDYSDEEVFEGFAIDKDTKKVAPKVTMKFEDIDKEYEYAKNDFYKYVPGTKVEILVNKEDGTLLSIVPTGDDALVNGTKKDLDDDYEALRNTEYDYAYAIVSGKEIDKAVVLTSNSVYVDELTVKENDKSIKISDGDVSEKYPDSDYDYAVILRDGERIKLKDVKEGEVLTTVTVKSGNKEAKFYVAGAKEEKGKISRLVVADYDEGDLSYVSMTVGGKEYKVAENAKFVEDPSKSDPIVEVLPRTEAQFDKKMKDEDVVIKLDPVFGNIVRIEFDGKIDGDSASNDVRFFGVADEVAYENKEYTVALIADDGTEKEYKFADNVDGRTLYNSEEKIKGSLAIVTLNDDGEIEKFEKFATTNVKGEANVVFEGTSKQYGDTAKESYAFKVYGTATYEADDNAIEAANGDSIEVNSSLIVVKLLCDDKGTDKESDDVYTVEFKKGLSEIEKLRKEDVVVVWDTDTDDDLVAKYVVLFDDASDRSEEKVGTVTKFASNLGQNEVTIEGEDKEVVIDKKNAISKEDEDTTVVVYTTKQDSNKDTVLTVVSKIDVNDAKEGTGIAKNGGLKATIRNEEFNLGTANGRKEYDKYKFVLVDVDTDADDNFDEISATRFVDINKVTFKQGDRFVNDKDEEVLYIVRGFKAGTAPEIYSYTINVMVRDTANDSYTVEESITDQAEVGSTVKYSEAKEGYDLDEAVAATVEASDDQVFEAKYTKKTLNYTVKVMVRDSADAEYTLSESKDFSGLYGSKVSYDEAKDGYNLDEAATGKLTEEGASFEAKYTRLPLNYKVKVMVRDSADAEYTLSETKEFSGDYGSQVNYDEAKKGYNLDEAATGTLTEEGAEFEAKYTATPTDDTGSGDSERV